MPGPWSLTRSVWPASSRLTTASRKPAWTRFSTTSRTAGAGRGERSPTSVADGLDQRDRVVVAASSSTTGGSPGAAVDAPDARGTGSGRGARAAASGVDRVRAEGIFRGRGAGTLTPRPDGGERGAIPLWRTIPRRCGEIV